jgi:hypothetical protein
MEDQPIGQWLRELPQETARPGFTARVVARLDREERPERAPALRPRLAWTAALVAALTISAGLIGIRDRPSPTAADTAEARRILAELKAEHDRLEQDFQELREPVYYLGGNEEIDLVMDLGNVTEGPEGDVAVPAAYRPTETF